MTKSGSRLFRALAFHLALVFALAVTLLGPILPARAAGGDLDTTFGTDGLVVTGAPIPAAVAHAVAVQPDGKIVAAGRVEAGSNQVDIALARYNSDGSLDGSFGGDGVVTTDLARVDEARDVVIQTDGKIVVAGNAGDGNGPGADVVIARYNPDGTLDPTFSGDGIALNHLGGGERWEGLALLPSGKLVAGGGRLSDRWQFAAGRYDADGTPDTTFDGDGFAFTDFQSGAGAHDVAVQTDGRIVAAGWSEPDPDGISEEDFALARYNTDGSLDATFEGDGTVTTNITRADVAWTVALQANGKIVAGGASLGSPTVGGTGGWDFALARYDTNGSLDPAFDSDGKVLTDFGSGADEAQAMEIQADGRIVTGGWSNWAEDFALSRYETDGALDTTMGVDGKVETDFGGSGDNAYGLAIQPDGSLVVAGFGRQGTAFGFALARYLPGDASPDPASDRDGDGIDDAADNCPDAPDPGQEDSDDDGIGDVCDTPADSDVDGVADDADNCAGHANAGQDDADGDGTGDACEPDTDGDGAIDDADNCAGHANAGQDDADGDGVGDLCDPDRDGDGITNESDTCPGTAEDFDGDQDQDGCPEESSDNTPPSVDAGSGVADAEGSAVALDGTVTDPNDGDMIGIAWNYAPDADVDASATCAFSDANAVDTTITCTDDGTYTATLTANDGVNTAVDDSMTVTVANAAPVATITTPGTDSLHSLRAGVDFSASFTDAGDNDTHTCSIDWGDGTPATMGSVTEMSGEGTCSASHTYAAAGLYTIAATITDDDSGSDTERMSIVVYDPSAGFVTGGGWIDSPAGAYAADASLAGRANFGFVSKYLKGATTPSGQTEFRFETAGLRFHSSSYEWLVVSGAKGQFKGSGTVNGSGGYGFLLTATDGQLTGGGGTDRFRIKIWEASSGILVYDNQVGAANGDDPTTGLGGGQIMIHKK